jgi:hypothetical protein
MASIKLWGGDIQITTCNIILQFPKTIHLQISIRVSALVMLGQISKNCVSSPDKCNTRKIWLSQHLCHVNGLSYRVIILPDNNSFPLPVGSFILPYPFIQLPICAAQQWWWVINVVQFDSLTMVLLMIRVVFDVTPWHSAHISQHFGWQQSSEMKMKKKELQSFKTMGTT